MKQRAGIRRSANWLKWKHRVRIHSPSSVEGNPASMLQMADDNVGPVAVKQAAAAAQNTGDTGKTNKREPQPQLDASKDTFHRAITPIMILGNFFALMPLTGMRGGNPRHVRFVIKSAQFLYTLVILFGIALLVMSMTKHLVSLGLNAKNLVGFVFFACVESAGILFLALATRWPRIIRYWSRVESLFTRPPYEILKPRLSRRVQFSGVIIVLLSIVEHGLYTASAVSSYTLQTKICAARRNETVVPNFTEYFRLNYEYAFALLGYKPWLGYFIVVLNMACTFIWNYMDLFIMMVSRGLSYRFEQITVRVNKLADQEIPETVFIEIREHYVKLCELLEYVDENMSGIILLSCVNNLYFVCYQLLNIFNKLRWTINYIYFWYSLLYLIGRTAFVFLMAASINDQSKSPLGVLRRVSSRSWCPEAERLVFEMSTQTVALSGKKFYFLTRRLLFGMAGTIVTYELVLLQFDEPNRVKGLPDLCA